MNDDAEFGLLPLYERLAYSQSGEISDTTVEPQALIKKLRGRDELIPRLEDMIWVQKRVSGRYQQAADHIVSKGSYARPAVGPSAFNRRY